MTRTAAIVSLLLLSLLTGGLTACHSIEPSTESHDGYGGGRGGGGHGGGAGGVGGGGAGGHGGGR